MTQPLSDTDTNALKPCPFCGDSAQVDRDLNYVAILCTNCNARTAKFLDDALNDGSRAVRSWNKRRPEQQNTHINAVERALDAAAAELRERVSDDDYRGGLLRSDVAMLAIKRLIASPKAPSPVAGDAEWLRTVSDARLGHNFDNAARERLHRIAAALEATPIPSVDAGELVAELRDHVGDLTVGYCRAVPKDLVRKAADALEAALLTTSPRQTEGLVEALCFYRDQWHQDEYGEVEPTEALLNDMGGNAAAALASTAGAK
jgi:Lar family restriction alleviation protein